jgi:1-deoxy-D-xylulose-5-phosphate synthase
MQNKKQFCLCVVLFIQYYDEILKLIILEQKSFLTFAEINLSVMLKYPVLEKVNTPDDLKKLSENELIVLCEELRQFILDVTSENPGHLGASLGVVELTVALHYVFATPYDQIVWDVGHQAYSHKILTGRRENFHTLRKLGGISGFPKMTESSYDAFGVGHSSTSISAALGIAKAARLKGENNRHVIAVIGDGSLTGGLAFEGLNNAGIDKEANLLVIVNDNNMAIDPNVGALNEYLLDITTSKTYNRLKKEVWDMLGGLNRMNPKARTYIKKLESGIKTMLLQQSNLFESMHFRYFGPVDGHDLNRLTEVLNDLKDIKGPKLLHVVTVKGHGYKFAEENQTKWHAPGYFNKETGEILKPSKDCIEPPRYQDVFGKTLLELARHDKRIVAITPAMSSGSSVNIMMKEMPERTFDVGIAEQHAVTFAAGMAAQGMIPVCAIYSSFAQRAYDQIVHDVAIQNLPVVFCLDRAGLVGDDGPTHHGAFDIGFMRGIPNMIVSAPMNEQELRNLLNTALTGKHGPFSIRYPRGKGVMIDWETPLAEVEIGKGRVVTEGQDVAIISLGTAGNLVQEALKELNDSRICPAHYDMRFAKPLDKELLHSIFHKFHKIITVEDGAITCGFGSAVLEFMCEHGYKADVVRLGIPDDFIEHGTQNQLYKICGFDPHTIAQTVKDLFAQLMVTEIGNTVNS